MGKIKIGTDYSGVGALNLALAASGIEYEEVFACDMDKYARKVFCIQYGTDDDVKLACSKQHDKICDTLLKHAKKGSVAPDEVLQAAEEMARQFSFYFPFNVYNRQIPEEPNDLAVYTPPCQAFSNGGKRLGKKDLRGILFFNTLECIDKNRPRFFILENVKGLLSNDKNKNNKQAEFGNTFNEWLNYLGGKSVNGRETIFPYEDSVPYHIYHFVINAKDYGVPQNRERVFIVGIRDDTDNQFTIPKGIELKKRLKDVLEEEVDEKYFLSDKMIKWLFSHSEKSQSKGNGFNFVPKNGDDIANTINSRLQKMGVDDNYIIIKANTEKGYEIATENDSINFSVPSSKTRRGRVGKGVAQILDTSCNQGVFILKEKRTEETKRERRENLARTGEDKSAFRGKELHIEESDVMNCLRTNISIENHVALLDYDQIRVRRLTPLECFRLMDFPDEFMEKIYKFNQENPKHKIFDSQLYKMAGNSIVVACLVNIIKKLNFKNV